VVQPAKRTVCYNPRRMTTATDLCYLTLHELSTRIRAKEVSPVEVTEAT
jgi:hypothetical protein